MGMVAYLFTGSVTTVRARRPRAWAKQLCRLFQLWLLGAAPRPLPSRERYVSDDCRYESLAMGATAAALGHTQLQSMSSIAATARVRAPHVPPLSVRVTPRPRPLRTRRTRCRLPRIVEAHARPSPAGWLDRPLHWRETLLPAHRVQITNRPHNYGFTRAQSHAPSAPRRSSCRKLSVSRK